MKIGVNTYGLSEVLAEDCSGALSRLREVGIDSLEMCIIFSDYPLDGKVGIIPTEKTKEPLN